MYTLLRDLMDNYPYDHSDNYKVVPGMLENFLGSNPQVHFHGPRPRRQTNFQSSTDTENDPNKYQVMVNVKHFRPEEIEVKTVDDYVVIHAKHEEHADEHGFVSREFTRKYQLPENVVPSTVKSSLSQNGMLTIQAPRVQPEPPKNERIVPITIQRPAAVEKAEKQQQFRDKQAAQEQQQLQEAQE